MNLPYKKAHFIGIGGIGMSALARLFLSENIKVTGSDASESDIIKKLKEEGAEISIGHQAQNISDDLDLVIYTMAVASDNQEFLEAQKKGIPIFTYAEMLGKISKNFFTIAVSGTHGKTTTTAMIIEGLQDAGFKPTGIVGSLLSQSSQNPGSNFVKGGEFGGNDSCLNQISGRKILVVEACEYGRSFLNLNPDILVITNIEEDHLDYYKDLDEITETFEELLSKVSKVGAVVANFSDEKIANLKIDQDLQKINYQDLLNQVPELKVFGKHNRENASAALGVASFLIKNRNEFEWENFKKALANFSGTWRRLEYKGQTLFEALVYDDYAHHPTEIKATLTALKEKFSEKKIIAIFQPHLYSRTKNFLNQFAEIFAQNSDFTFLVPIYAAREKNDETINSLMLAKKINEIGGQADFCESFFEVTKKVLPKEISQNSVIVVLGAGDIYKVANMLGVKY